MDKFRSHGVDMIKGLSIFGVVLLHTIPYQLDNPLLTDEGQLFRQIWMQLSRLAVPFFLIAAGYFFSRGAPPGEFWPRWWKYTRRLLPLVLAWSLIDGVFSLDWLRKTEAHGLSYLYWKLIAIPGFAIDHPELFLFRGTIGPLWFVFGLVYSLTALTIFRMMRLSSR